MNPNSDSVDMNREQKSSRRMPPKGSEGVLPLPTHQSPNTDIKTAEKPSRSSQSGEGTYEGTNGYAKRIKSYLRNNDVDTAADAPAPLSKREAPQMLAAESEPASCSKSLGQ